MIGFIFVLLQSYLYTLIPGKIKILFEIIVEKKQNNFYPLLGELAILLTAMVITMYIMRYLIIVVSRKVQYDFRKSLLVKITHLPLRFYDAENTGDLISRIINDLEDIRTFIGPGLMYIMNSLSKLIFIVPLMLAIQSQLFFFLLIQMSILVVIILIIMPKIRPIYNEVQKVKGFINNIVWEILTGLTTIQLNNAEKQKSKQFNKTNHEYIEKNIRLAKWNSFTWPFFIFFFSLGEVIIIWITGKAIIKGEFLLADFLYFQLLYAQIAFPVFALGWVISIFQQGISALERIGKINFYHSDEENKIKRVKKDSSYQNFLNHFRGDIKIENLFFRYPNRVELNREYHLNITHEKKNSSSSQNSSSAIPLSAVSPLVIENFTLNIRAGQKIGIIGGVGSGKTTFFNLLAGLYKIKKGSITIDDFSINDILAEDIYHYLSFVPQQNFLFSDTIANNIAFSEDVDLDKIIECAKISDIDKDIQAFQNGYHEMIGERGIMLSGGQKQRVAIARALYKNSKILLMDDSFSSIDVETSKNIIDNLLQKKDQTILMSSYKASILKRMDKIIIIENGKIVAIDDHQSLAKTSKEYQKIMQIEKEKI